MQTRGSLIVEQVLPQLEERCSWTIKIFCSAAALMCTVLYMLVFGLCVFKLLVLEMYASVCCALQDCAVASRRGSFDRFESLHAADRVQESIGIVLHGFWHTAAIGSANASTKNAFAVVM